jgi:hypothetical protein
MESAPDARCLLQGVGEAAPDARCLLQGEMHWSRVLLKKLNSKVKLVGATISCQGAPLHGDGSIPKDQWRKNPHVQSYLVATDQAGMALLLKDRRIFKCYEKIADTIYHSELGVSRVILHAGYNIDCLMVGPSYSNCTPTLVASVG